MTGLNERSVRERILIYIGGVLFVFLVVWQLGVNPILDGKAQSERRTASAQRDLNIVSSGLAQITPTQNTPRLNFEQPLIVGTAQEMGLTISRTQPERDGAMSLWFNNTTVENLYKFLETVSNTYTLSIGRVQITQSSLGTVDAQISLLPEK